MRLTAWRATHKLILRNTWTHNTDKTAREFSGYDGVTDSFLSSQRLRLVKRDVFASGLEGEHVFTGWKKHGPLAVDHLEIGALRT